MSLILILKNVLSKSPPILHANAQGNIDQALKQAWLRAGNAAKAQPQLVMCILPNTGVPLYAGTVLSPPPFSRRERRTLTSIPPAISIRNQARLGYGYWRGHSVHPGEAH